MQPGHVIAGKYRVERRLGEGGMGAVYVAINERLQKRVALKVLREELARMPEAAERMTREAIAASRARHPGIVEIYDADTTDGVTWIAMELLEGESLGERMQRGRMSYGEAVAVVCEALDALDAVHRHGVIHRDLKPDNLFLAQTPAGPRVKVLDFGIAASTTSELARVTQTGMTIGTPAYFAPEQASGERELDARVDVYAMGTILFELITGQLPYRAESLGALVREMFTRGPPSLSAFDASAPAELVALMAACLAVKRDQRPASAGEMRRQLQALTGIATGPVHARPPVANLAPPGVGPLAPSPAAPAVAPSTPARVAPATASPDPSRLWILGGLAGLAGIVGVGAIGTALFFATRDEPPAVAAVAPVAAPLADPTPGLEPVAPAAISLDDGAGSDAVSPAGAPAPDRVAPPEPAAEEPPAEPDEAPDAQAEAAAARRAARRRRGGRRRRSTDSPTDPPSRAPAERAPPASPPAPVAQEPRPIAPAVWTAILRQHESELDGCYSRHFTPPRPRVSTQVTMQVNTRGAVTSTAVAGAPRPLARCLEGVLRRARFPTNDWPSRGTFRMTLYDTP